VLKYGKCYQLKQSRSIGDFGMNCEIIEKMPSAEEYNRLRLSVGWGIYDLELIDKSLPRSLFCVCALVNSEVVGMARLIGDDGLVFYIQDMIVTPDLQLQGIGKLLMNRLMEYIHTHARQNSIIGLMSAKGKEKFYERYGFTSRPTGSLGNGMTIVWGIDQQLSRAN
jgi:GNAT superfamily N-acetyltransferase